MFQGTLPESVRSILKQEATRWGTKDLYLPCAGRFTVARGMVGDYRIHGNDISLYSCALGALYAGAPFPLKLVDADGDLGWMAPFMDTRERAIASVLIWSDMAMAWAKRKVNPYYARLAGGYQRQFPKLHEKTLAKMEATKLHLESFWAGDCVDYVRTIPEGAGIITAPPVYCMAPTERILTADLRWVPCGELIEGDGVLTFDEEPSSPGRCRNWKFGVVTRSERARKECVRVHLENGDCVVCTTDHPWLADKYEVFGGSRRWVRADSLLGRWVVKLTDTWEPDRSYEGGWLAGILDGEGSVSIGGSSRLNVGQRPGVVADQISERLGARGFGLYVHTAKSGVLSMEVSGGFPAMIKALGTFRPERLIGKLGAKDVSTQSTRRQAVHAPKVKVVKVEPLGEREVQSISTSAKTYVGEGYAMHNTGGYEAMWKYLEAFFEWESPEYAMFDLKRFDELMDLLKPRGRWAIITQSPVPGLEENLVGQVRETDRGTLFMVYAAAHEGARLVRPNQKVEPLMAEKLGGTEEIQGPLGLQLLTMGEFNGLRSMYLNENIRPGQAMVAAAVTANGKVIGAIAGQPANSSFSLGVEMPALYLLSDFPIRPTRYKRLSKLLVMAALSKEFRLLAERTCNTRFNSLFTTAFSKNPVSMKYRGLLDLVKRGPAEDEDKRMGFNFKLNYASLAGRWTLEESLAEWRKSYADAD